jgi:heat shock protein HtpX
LIGLNRVKTWILIAALGGLFVLVGAAIGGQQGLVVALAIALVFNFSMYWFSDKIAIATTRSKPVTEQEAPGALPDRPGADAAQPDADAEDLRLGHDAAERVRHRSQPRARRRGGHPRDPRDPGRARAAGRAGARALARRQPRHPDRFDRGGHRDEHHVPRAVRPVVRLGDDRNGIGIVGLLLAWVLRPIAAAIIQMAVSRSREYQADESGAILSRDPDALASALRKLENAAGKVPVPASVSPAEAHLFIVNPFRGRQASMSLANLFSTHPPTAERIARLEQIKQEIA